jgi:hypothetical protein
MIQENSAEILSLLHHSAVLERYPTVNHHVDVEMITEEYDPIELSDLLDQVHDIIVGCLSASLSRLFEKGLGLEWKSKLSRPPPWTLSDLFEMISKDPVFRDLPVEMRHLNLGSMNFFAKDIERSVRQHQAMITKGDLDVFLWNMDSVLFLCDQAGLPSDRKKASTLLSGIRSKLNYI